MSSRRPDRRGYVMLIALVLFGALTTVGAMTLSVSSVDQRVAYHQQRHVQARYSAHAATQHGRFRLMFLNPTDNGWSTPATGWAPTTLPVQASYNDGSDWSATNYVARSGEYDGFYRWEQCSTAAPGFSAELGSRSAMRTDFWRIFGQGAVVTDLEYETNAEARMLASKVVRGECKIR
jgi:hypothetical protein